MVIATTLPLAVFVFLLAVMWCAGLTVGILLRGLGECADSGDDEEHPPTMEDRLRERLTRDFYTPHPRPPDAPGSTE